MGAQSVREGGFSNRMQSELRSQCRYSEGRWNQKGKEIACAETVAKGLLKTEGNQFAQKRI